MPAAVVTSVHEVDETKTNKERMAIGPEERTLAKVYPVVFCAWPGVSVILGLAFLAAVVAMVMLFGRPIFLRRNNDSRFGVVADVGL